jgi:putative DeoR family transcriptional regulator (stage III sporulation protein D)
LKSYIEERAVEVAKFIVNTNATVRETAKTFGIIKLTVYIMDDTK